MDDRISKMAEKAKGLPKADRKSTRLNSSHVAISYAVFCLKKKYDFWTLVISEMREGFSETRCRIVLTLNDGRATSGPRIAQIDAFFFKSRGPPQVYPPSPPEHFPN